MQTKAGCSLKRLPGGFYWGVPTQPPARGAVPFRWLKNLEAVSAQPQTVPAPWLPPSTVSPLDRVQHVHNEPCTTLEALLVSR